MLTSLKWLNRYLEPATLTADEAEHFLTFAGFPIDSRDVLPDGDVRLDVELTSNRGDCLSHVGLAREVASAASAAGRPCKFVKPALGPTREAAEQASSVTSVENRLASSGGCPRFTARVIRGVKIGPSPEWMSRFLESVGVRSINNVVDVTNFVNLELGHPCHVFDLDTLAGRRLIVRSARTGESVVTLDGVKRELRDDEMVVADAEKAVSIAGVMGGLESGVTDRTRNVLLEMATWDPQLVRRVSRRLELRTDASHRFERYVDARDIDFALARAAAMILEFAGGELLQGVIDEGSPAQPRRVVNLRSNRVEHVLGVHVSTVDMVKLLSSIGIEVTVERHGSEERLRCVIPPHRHDLSREVDLIEEVARLNGFDKITLAPGLDAPLSLAHPSDWARRERATDVLGRVLSSAGFFETVTFSFLKREHAEGFLPGGSLPLMVDEARRKDTPYLRPSVIPSLLSCRRANQDAKVTTIGGVRLYEMSAVFARPESDPGATRERRVLTLYADAPADVPAAEAPQAALRVVRGAIESCLVAVGGRAAVISVEPAPAVHPTLRDETTARVLLAGKPIGVMTTIGSSARAKWELEAIGAAAEIDLQPLIDLYPPKATASALPRFPAIERDLSVVVDERVPWSRIESTIVEIHPALMERIEFVGVYRGKQLGAGKKSVTLRMTFRDPKRTLEHEEVDPQVASAVEALGRSVGGVLRGP